MSLLPVADHRYLLYPGRYLGPSPGEPSAASWRNLDAQAKTDGTTTYTPGTTLTYTITVTNNGPSDITGATVTDTFPPTITSATWTCTPSGSATCTPSGSGNINDTVSIPAGQSITYTVTAQVSASASGPLVNIASVSPPPGVVDPVGNNDAASDTDQQYLEPIPTLSESGVFILALLLGCAALWLLARKMV